MKIVIVIPSRMASERLPNKPMVMIHKKTMIQRVWEQAKISNIGDVIVACGDEIIQKHITSIGGRAVMTDPKLPSGTDRVYAALENMMTNENYELVINLQGDMPLINSDDIKKIILPIQQGFQIGTLVTNFENKKDYFDYNITKVSVEWIKKYYIGKAIDFNKDYNYFNSNNVFHHVGIYSFKIETLKKFVSLPISSNEKLRKLEQMRALDSNMTIGLGYVNNVPISIDTENDLIKIRNKISKTKYE
ncbi:MAG: 3-deoxy-manno-octulosonate cytidylyltransferase [Alphaproteobacteria bacterium MarineAlpha5_Bin9]|nr:MAG: 3-deoxy-manno-octulosonate cytidylyltransferase [Alphaproteobacteria bacterium MarineAlpha5_Bin9]|tara:strand:+ start:8674 stop:9414 length:741 start_codon:yes stop_codon:yes gene_type:complete